MIREFCYCCKRVIEAQDLEEFRKSGHVHTKEEAKTKYAINISLLPKTIKAA